MDFKKIIIETPELLEKLANLEREPLPHTPIVSAKIKLLWQCNLSCTFCDRSRPDVSMTREKVKETLAALRDQGLVKVHFSGGEVFVHPDIFPILEEACSMGLQVNLTSNGTLLNKEKVRRLSTIGVHSVSISLDAADPALHDRLRGKKGAFKATLKTLTLLANNSKKRPKLWVNTVVTRQNIHNLDDIHQLLKGLNPSIHWKLIPVETTNKKLLLAQDRVNALYQEAAQWDLLDTPLFVKDRIRPDQKFFSKGKYGTSYYTRFRCYMPWLHMFIDPTGFVYPCCMARNRIPALGNIYNMTIDQIISGTKYRELRMNMAASHILETCRYCGDFLPENMTIHSLINIEQ